METHLVNSRVLGASGATVRADIVGLLRADSCNSGGNRKFELLTIADSCKENCDEDRKVE